MWEWALQLAVKFWAADHEIRQLSPGQTTELPEIKTHYQHGRFILRVTVERDTDH